MTRWIWQLLGPLAAWSGMLLEPQHVPVQNRTLLPWAFVPLPLGAISPAGWLHGELTAMAAGLAGHQLNFYPYVRDSRWLDGRTDYSPLNEALPYWFNGLVPLAYLLRDARLQEQVHSVAETVLGRAAERSDGWIGPEASKEERNLWGRTPFLLGLVQLADANATAWREPVVSALLRYFRLVNEMVRNDGEGFTKCRWGTNDCSWGQVRVHDLIIVIQWLLENENLAALDELVLWETMELLYYKSQFKWEHWYHQSRYQQIVHDPTPGNPSFPYLHGVNVGQGLKASAVIRRFTYKESLADITLKAVEWTFKYHGAPSGTILADEIQRDLAPWMGSELCTAVETGYSLAYLYHALGVNAFADRAERVIFNALPVMLTEDMWAHQYLDQPNGPWATNQMGKPSPFTTAHGMATIFGLEPQYPCCTVNFPQGYPKFVANSWARSERGLVHILLSPSAVDTSLFGGRVTIICDTSYPFNDILTYSITTDKPFDLLLRIPGWSAQEQSSITLVLPTAKREKVPVLPDKKSGLQIISIPAGKSSVVYVLGAAIRVEPRQNRAVSVYVGSLLYSLDVGTSVASSLPHRYYNAPGDPTKEFNATYPQIRDYYFNYTKPWNVAIDPTTLIYHTNSSHGICGERAFVADCGNLGGHITVRGCQVDWQLLRGATPDTPPRYPRCIGREETFRMIPYGIAKVHMSEVPTVDLTSELRWQADTRGSGEDISVENGEWGQQTLSIKVTTK